MAAAKEAALGCESGNGAAHAASAAGMASMDDGGVATAGVAAAHRDWELEGEGSLFFSIPALKSSALIAPADVLGKVRSGARSLAKESKE